MDTITFFNKTININPIAFTIFGIDVYYYAIIMVSAIIIALLICKKRDGLYDIKSDNILDLAIFVIPIAIICARLYYVLFSLEYYIQDPIRIISFRSGGLAIYGGIIGGVITCYVFCKIKKINLLDLLDYIAPCLALGQALGRWGNFFNIEAYGTTTNLPWRMGIYEMGQYVEVHPTFLYESLATFSIFILLMIISKKRKFKGQITYLYLILYSVARAVIEPLRTDSLMLGNIRVSAMLSAVLFIVFISIYIYKTTKLRKNKI